MQFRPAVRKQVKLKIALTGPSGSGKTMSSLLIAEGIGKNIAVIDTENDSASLYGDRFTFQTLNISPPYTIPKFVEAIKLAENNGFDIVVLDSLSHAWIGEGGLLAKKEAMDARGGSGFANWGAITKEHEQLKSAILNSKIHMICTMRSKQDYAQEKDERGKTVIKKLGLAPQQRDGLEFEFAVVLDLGMDHHAQVSKDRTGTLDGQIFKPTKDTGKDLIKWLNSGAPIQSEPSKVNFEPDEIDKPIEKPSQPVSTSVQPPGMRCLICGSELRMHSRGLGYICPRATRSGDGHTRVALAQVDEFRKRMETESWPIPSAH